MEPRCNILVIDDEEDVGEFISASAHTLGLDCVATTDATGLLNRCAPEPALILLDLIMPGMDGIEVLRLLGERKCKARIVLMSGLGKNVLQTAEKLAQSLGLTIVGHLQHVLAEAAPSARCGPCISAHPAGAQHFNAVHARHDQVQQDQCRLRGAPIQKADCVCGCNAIQAQCMCRGRDKFTYILLIVDDQDVATGFHRPSSSP